MWLIGEWQWRVVTVVESVPLLPERQPYTRICSPEPSQCRGGPCAAARTCAFRPAGGVPGPGDPPSEWPRGRDWPIGCRGRCRRRADGAISGVGRYLLGEGRVFYSTRFFVAGSGTAQATTRGGRSGGGGTTAQGRAAGQALLTVPGAGQARVPPLPTANAERATLVGRPWRCVRVNGPTLSES